MVHMQVTSYSRGFIIFLPDEPEHRPWLSLAQLLPPAFLAIWLEYLQQILHYRTTLPASVTSHMNFLTETNQKIKNEHGVIFQIPLILHISHGYTYCNKCISGPHSPHNRWNNFGNAMRALLGIIWKYESRRSLQKLQSGSIILFLPQDPKHLVLAMSRIINLELYTTNNYQSHLVSLGRNSFRCVKKGVRSFIDPKRQKM